VIDLSRPSRRTVVLAAGAAVVAPSATLAAPKMPQMPPARMHGEPGVLPMVEDWTLPAVEATVHGKGPFRFGLDTGAPGGLHLGSRAAAALALQPAGWTRVGDPSGKKPLRTPVYPPQTIGLGRLTFDGVETDGFPDVPGPGPAIDGLLGMDIFDALTLTLDFKRRAVGFSRQALPPPDSVSVLAYPPGPFIVVPLAIGGVTVEAVVDTGQIRAPLMAPEAMVARLPTRGSPRSFGIAHTVSQTLTLYAVALEGSVRLGGVALPVTEVVYPTVTSLANVGAKALQDTTLTIDRASHRVRLAA